MRIDINADLGEGFGRYTCGDDDGDARHRHLGQCRLRLPCRRSRDHGAHLRVAKSNGVASRRASRFPRHLGLWPPDDCPFSDGEIERLVAYQIGAAQALASYAGATASPTSTPMARSRTSHETDRDVARRRGAGDVAVDRNLAALAIARREQVRARGRARACACSRRSMPTAPIPSRARWSTRAQPGAVIHDAGRRQSVWSPWSMAGALITVTGAKLKTPIDFVCVHGDSPDAVAAWRAPCGAKLEAAGVTVAPFGAS